MEFIIAGVVGLVVGAAVVYFILAGKSGSRLKDAEARLAGAHDEAQRIAEEARRQAESAKQETILEA